MPKRSAEALAPSTLSQQESRLISGFTRHYGLTFRRPELLKLALTHRSYLSVTGQGPRESNERLEFLGDSVLGLVTSEFLYREYPSEHEGQLTKTKSLLVSKAILSRRALAMGLGRFVLMSHSEVESGGRQRLSIIADAFEAVVGAIYIDQGFEEARQFIARWLLSDSREILADKRHTNYKSHLQEFVQSTYRTHPIYRIRSEMGPDHSKQFNVEVMVGKRVLGTGKGPNKKEAEQAAARDALQQVGGPPSARPMRERRPAAPAREPESAEAPGGARTESPDEESGQRRRRRGRRGGRGRQGRISGEAPPSSPPSPGTPSRQSRPPEGRAEPARSEAAMPMTRAPARDVEPEPPAHDDHDFEEIGRPEGPLEERHIDPFASEGSESEARPSHDVMGDEPSSGGRAWTRNDARSGIGTPPPVRADISESSDEEERSDRERGQTDPGSGDTGPGTPPGRRFGRTRRGPRGR